MQDVRWMLLECPGTAQATACHLSRKAAVMPLRQARPGGARP